MNTIYSTGRQLMQAELRAEKSYWLERLAPLEGLPHLVPDYVWSQQEAGEYGVIPLLLPEPLYRRLCQMTNDSPFLLYVLLATATGICLRKYTGSETVVIGSPATQDCEQANMLAIVEHINEQVSLHHLLQDVRKLLVEAYKRQQYPFRQLLKDLSLPESSTVCPLFDVVVALTAIHGEVLQVGQGLTLTFSQEKDGLVGRVEFQKRLFSRQSVEDFVARLQQVLCTMTEHVRTSVGQIDIMLNRERQQQPGSRKVIRRAQAPEELCIHHLFEAQAARFPEKIAVVCEDAQITYEELNRRANQLAHYLRGSGVGPETLIGLCTERSLEMVVGIIAILKADGAYVPLDPAYPQERLAYIMEDTRISVLLTQQRVAAALPDLNAKIICLDSDDSDWRTMSTEQSGQCVSHVQAENLAYVIYTSGSTGRPKGVGVSHRNVTRLFTSTQSWFLFSEYDVWTIFHSYAFDFSVWELWGALSYGGRLVVVPYLVSRSPEAFHTLLRTEQVTVLNHTPSAFHQLMRIDAGSGGENSLRYVIFGGEALDLHSLQPWFDRHGEHRPRLLNMYGITETTVHVTYRPLSYKDASNILGSMIGQPIPDLYLYILDHNLQTVPEGVLGELYVGGAGLARGYLNNPDLTAARFIPDPFSSVSGARLYRTGDLARRRADGDIEYLGRIDQQVKIRGFRIELGEIEAVLSQHPSVDTAVVLPQEDGSGNKRLVAYVVLRTGETLPAGELRRFLQSLLPDYMLPSAFLSVERLPLTPNGKVDRKALLALEQKQTIAQGDVFVAPRTPVEKILADIWTEVLGLERVGIYDNFFEVGGDSILSIQVVARAHEAGLHLRTKHVFEYQNIAELAAVASTSSIIQAEQDTLTGPVYLTPIQEWFFEQEMRDPHHWNQSLLLKMREPLVMETLEQGVTRLLHRHDVLRLRFKRGEQGWQQYFSEPEAVAPLDVIALHHLSQQAQKEAIERVCERLQGSLDLEQGPMLRVAYFDLGGEQEDRLLLVAHHLVIDGVSWRILLEDLQSIYTQLHRGQSLKLPAKTTSYRYWSNKLRDYAASQRLLEEVPCWQIRGKQSKALGRLESSLIHNTEASCRSVSTLLSIEETRALLYTLPGAYQVTINDILLSALLQAWQRWTGEDGLLVELEGHGREPLFEDVNLSRTIGWFTSIYPLYLEASGKATPEEALRAVNVLTCGIHNHGIDYGVLRYLHENQEVRQMLRNLPQAQVSFNYLGQFDRFFGEGTFFAEAPESTGPNHSQLAQRRYLLEIVGSVMGGQLRLNWNYSQHLHQRSAIEALAEHYTQALRALIACSQFPKIRSYTPADFQGARVSQQDLAKLLSHFYAHDRKQVEQ